MASFPALKTGAYAQYPSDRTRQCSTSAYRFIDGSEQRFPGYGIPLRQWTIRLDLLDEGELAALEQFFVDQGGRVGTFSFTDPFDGTVCPSCRFGSDTAAFAYAGAVRGSTMVTIGENRG